MENAATLRKEIEGLSLPQVVECASFCLPTVLNLFDNESVREQMADRLSEAGGQHEELTVLLRAVSSDRASYEALFRICLLAAAEGPSQDQQVVQESIEGVGRNAFEIDVSQVVLFASFFLLTGRFIVRPIIKDYLSNPVVTHEEIEETETTSADGSRTKITKSKRDRQPLPLSNLFDWIGRLKPSLLSGK